MEYVWYELTKMYVIGYDVKRNEADYNRKDVCLIICM